MQLYGNLSFQVKKTALVLGVHFLWILQVQSLIKQEVCSAMEKNETKLKGLIETIEHLDRKVNYESTIQKLEVGSSG